MRIQLLLPVSPLLQLLQSLSLQLLHLHLALLQDRQVTCHLHLHVKQSSDLLSLFLVLLLILGQLLLQVVDVLVQLLGLQTLFLHLLSQLTHLKLIGLLLALQLRLQRLPLLLALVLIGVKLAL